MVIDMGYFTKVLKKILVLTISLIAIFLSFKLALFLDILAFYLIIIFLYCVGVLPMYFLKILQLKHRIF